MYKDYVTRAFIGKRISEVREAQGMTVDELSEKIEMRPKSLLRIEQGKYSVTTDLLMQILNGLDYHIDIVPNN